eukprot:403338103
MVKLILQNAKYFIGNFMCIYLNDGNFILNKTKDQQSLNIKGIQKPEQRRDESQVLPYIFINNEGTIIIIKYPNSDCFWMWTMSKEQSNLSLLEESSLPNTTSNQTPLDIPKKPLMRSSSYDKKPQQDQQFADVKQEGQANSQNVKNLKGSWLNIQMKDLSGPYAQRSSSFQDGLDLKFINQLYSQQTQAITGLYSCDSVKLLQVKLFSKMDYFCKKDVNNHSQNQLAQNEEEMIVEISSQNLRVNFVNKGSSYFESSSSNNHIKQKISTVEYTGQVSQKNKPIITKLDNSCNLAITVLNSQHMVYCQILFSNFDTSFATAIKLFDFVSPDDCPTFDSRGKTNLCIDDVCWTNNDAFVLIIFNSCSFAVLPRLGSNLVKIFNPTIMNISQKMVDQFQHYKTPKSFNELILPMPIQQKHPQAKQSLSLNQKYITMHPYEESIIISDGQMVFIFRIEFEPELTDLFSKTNMSYFFLRFCISLDRLAIDPDILEKIPQLLTNKLPLFEFEKNAELDEEDDPGQVIMTASQINPYDNNARRMETNQSFNAEFTLDCQTVLLNLKHLLMGLRWNKNSPINYYQWLITVINDCFFYFLKNSEPIYAFHALRMAEAYCKKSLFLTESDNDIDAFEARAQEFHSSRDTDYTQFETLKKFFDAVHDMYDYHNTQEYMSKTTAEKMLIKYDMFTKFPARLTRGSGNWRFQFSKNYTLLVYYSLIQFRNYQAANFNILFLVFACYILQRYLDSMFSHHLQKIIEIVYRNFQMQKKSDDYELFLGKSGKNYIIGPPEKMKIYQDWVSQVFKFSLEHLGQLYEQENMENMLDICLNELNQNHEKVEKNIGYLGDNGFIFKIANNIIQFYENQKNQLIKTTIIDEIKREIGDYQNSIDECLQPSKRRVKTFNICTSLYLICEITRRNKILKQNESLNIFNLYSSIHRLIVQSGSPDNLQQEMGDFGEIMNENFKASNLDLSELNIFPNSETLSISQIQQILSVLYFYMNDIDAGIKVLDINQDKDKYHENQLLQILMLSTTIKQSMRQLELINQQTKEKDSQQSNNQANITLFQQKANCVQSMRKAIGLLKHLFQEIMTQKNKTEVNGSVKESLNDRLYAAINMLPQSTSIILREELAHQSLKNVNKILKYLKIQNPLIKQNKTFVTIGREKSQKQSQSHLFDKLFGQDSLETLESLIQNERITHILVDQIELILISLTDYDKDKIMFEIENNEIVFAEALNQDQQNEKSNKLQTLIIQDFKKFAKIMCFIKNIIELQKLEIQFSNQSNLLIFGSQSKISADQYMLYIETLLKVSLFEKYSPSQILISKAANVMKSIISQETELQMSNLFQLVQYQTLNRQNKQKISQILDLAKLHKDNLKELVGSLENFIFSEKQQNPIDLLLQDYQGTILNITNNEFKLKEHMINGENLYKHTKMVLFERCLQVRDMFGLSFDYSFFFDRASFERRNANIFGLTDSTLDKFKALMQKQEERKQRIKRQSEQAQQIQKSEGNNQPSQQITQLSFRGREMVSDIKSSLSIESARSYIILESPGRVLQGDIDPEVINNHGEIMKNLMKNRQMGIPMTPNRSDLEKLRIQGDIAKIVNQGGIKVRKVKANQSSKNIREKSPVTKLNKRNDSVEFENQEFAAANVMRQTKRRDSIRRQFVFIGNQNEDKQNNQEGQKQQRRGQHRKGQMSMNPQGMVQNNFNLKNQKLIDPNFNQNTQNHPVHRPGPPPGLPKASAPQSKRNLKTQNSVKSNQQLVSKEEKLKHLLLNFQKNVVKAYFISWKQQTPPKSPAQSYAKQMKQNPLFSSASKSKVTKGSFNLLLVKKDGDQYTVQDAKQILKEKGKNQSISISSNAKLTQQFDHKQVKQTQLELEQTKQLINQKIITAKPFQFIRVQNPSLSIQPSATGSSMNLQQQEEVKIENMKSVANSNSQPNKHKIIQLSNKTKQQKPEKKSIKQEQYLNFIVIYQILLILFQQKFKQISEKIEKVQKDANNLTSEFQKLN